MIIDEILTDRLVMAPLDPNMVLDRYVGWMNDAETIQYLESRKGVQTRQTIHQYVLDNNQRNDAILLGISEKSTRRHVGNIRLSEISWVHGHAEIGLLIGEKDRWGLGYAQEAISSLTRAAFERLNLRKLVAGCYLSNQASIRAFKRCDYKQVGRLQAHWRLDDRFDDQILLEYDSGALRQHAVGAFGALQVLGIPERMEAIRRALADKRYSQGERMFLRPLVPDDVGDRYISWFSDTTVVSFLETRNVTHEASLAYLKHGLTSGEYFMCALCDRATGLHIGNVKLGPISWTHGTSDLVTVIGDRTFWGRGLATEAISIGSRLMLEGVGLRKLHGSIYASNMGSVNAYTRGGWIIESRLKDHVLHDGEPMDIIQVSCFPSGLKPR